MFGGMVANKQTESATAAQKKSAATALFSWLIIREA
jgi:hypothetical protein